MATDEILLKDQESARDTSVKHEADHDRKLLAAITHDDRSALAELYDRHSATLMGVAYRILQNRRDAEDLLHDVFLEAWHKAASYDSSRGTVRNWLIMRVRSRAIDRLRSLTSARKKAILQANNESAQIESVENTYHSPDHERARRALAHLSDAQRMVIELLYFEGLSCQEIALRCEIPIGTVKSRLSAALNLLRNALGLAGEQAIA